jgi:hypothetical protein
MALIPSWVWLAIIATLSAFGVYEWGQHNRVEKQLFAERAGWSDQNAERAEAARGAEAEFRKLEQRRNSIGQEISDGLQKQIDTRETQLRAERAGSERLRNDAAAFAASRGPVGQACPAELAGTRDRAATLGQLFSEADSFAGEMVDAAERHAAEARTLKARALADREP